MESFGSRMKEKNNFVVQAGILAIAGIITRIIGLLYRSPLHGIIGDLGMGYYQSAYAYYTIILLISSYSIPSAISKVIAQRLAVKEYRNAHRIFHCALIYVLVVGGIASLFLYFGSGLFVEEAAVKVLRVFAPTIFVYGILGVLRGYFQAHKSMVQTSLSQIVEQIINAFVSVGAAYWMILAFCGTLDVPEDIAGQQQRAIYGAMGSALGTGLGVFAALLFMIWVYCINRKAIIKKVQRDTKHEVEDYKTIFKIITLIVTPFIISTAINNLSNSLNTKIFTDFYPSVRKLEYFEITRTWGIYSGQAMTISNIPIAFGNAMSAAMMPAISALIAAKDYKSARKKVGISVKVTMLISIPCAAGMFALAKPVTDLLFSNKSEVLEFSGRLLMALSLSVIFYTLSALNSTILQGIGKVNTPIINAVIALVCQTAIACGLLFFTNLGVYSIAIASTVYAGLMCILNQMAVRKALDYHQEYRKTFMIPALSASIMGILCWLIYQGLYALTKSMKLSVIPAIIVGAGVYFLVLLLLKGVTETELRAIPKGTILIKIAKKLHLLK